MTIYSRLIPINYHSQIKLTILNKIGAHMTKGDKSKYTEKQKRQAKHIESGYEEHGVAKDEAKKRAWATVNKMHGGGKKSGSGVGKGVNKEPARKGGRIGGSKAKKS
jgi:hypothetical protein